MTIENTPVRFFATRFNDIVEVSESTFKELGGNISYERHTMFDNRRNQICLTTDEEMED